jgi:hypothetical protein
VMRRRATKKGEGDAQRPLPCRPLGACAR